MPGTLILEDGAEPCTVFDISPSGASISATGRARIDQLVRLKLTQNGEFVARVVWSQGERIGLKFEHLSEDGPFVIETAGSHVTLVS